MHSAFAFFVSLTLSILLHFAAITQFFGEMKTPGALRPPNQTANQEIIHFYIPAAANSIANDGKNPHTSLQKPGQNSLISSVGALEGTKRSLLAFDSKRYLTTDSLHTRAAPKIDWIIKKNLLPANELILLRFTVWVSAEGLIDHLEPEGAEAQPNWLTEALVYLKQTVMEPATLNDQPVASSMTVEIFIDGTDK